MPIKKTEWCTVQWPIFIPLWVYLLHKSHLSRILNCCFLCNIIIAMMYYSEKKWKILLSSPIISGSEKTRSASSCSIHLWASSTQASSPLKVLGFLYRGAEGNTREHFSCPNKNHQFWMIPEHGTAKRAPCVPRVSTLCIPEKHTGHTAGDLLHFNCTSWDEAIKQKRGFLRGTKSWEE